MKKRALQIAIEAREASVIELSVGERVQLDRVTRSPAGNIAERHGALLEPGVNTLDIAAGHYCLRTLSDTHLRVIRGGVDTVVSAGDKQGGPIELAVPDLKGDDGPGEQPRFTVE